LAPQQVHSPYQRESFITKFLQWADRQQYERLFWLAFTLMFHACVLTPITALVASTSSNSFLVIIGAIVSISMIVITGLAALPTRITIPTFFISVLLDLALIGYALISNIS
jgi:hypothetical protein